jgi:hypothetical protein
VDFTGSIIVEGRLPRGEGEVLVAAGARSFCGPLLDEFAIPEAVNASDPC